jgi:hypothetical protein
MSASDEFFDHSGCCVHRLEAPGPFAHFPSVGSSLGCGRGVDFELASLNS